MHEYRVFQSFYPGTSTQATFCIYNCENIRSFLSYYFETFLKFIALQDCQHGLAKVKCFSPKIFFNYNSISEREKDYENLFFRI
jgi:hypothetical protein